MDLNTLILTTNLLFSTLIFWIIAKLYVLPNLSKWDTKKIVVPILLLQSTRHLGLMFLAGGVVHADISTVFTYPAALGDFTTAILALLTLGFVLRGTPAAWPMVWVVTIFGTIDFLTAIVLATIHNAAGYMSAAWWIPAIWVPAALVAHYVTFVILWRRREQNLKRD